MLATAFGLFGNLTKNSEAATVPSQTLTLAWDAPPETNLQGYKVYVGTQSLQYPVSYVVGNQLTYQVTGLTSGQTYYFAVTAIGSTGIESLYSAEVVSKIPSPPVSLADTYTTDQGVALVIPATGVLTNDSDPQALPLTAILDAPPSYGTLTLNSDGSFLYTPVASYVGADSFTYHANNGSLDSNTTNVGITINAVNYGSLANGSFESNLTGWTTSGNFSIESALPYRATDGNQLIAFNSKDLAANGVFSQTLATNVGRTYTIAFDVGVYSYNQNQQSLRVTATGTSNLLSQTVTLTGLGGGSTIWAPQSFTFVADRATTIITFTDVSTSTNSLDLLLDHVRITEVITPINTAPNSLTDTYTTNANTPLVIASPGVLANDTDAESNALTAIMDTNPSHGALTLNPSGGFTYTPVAAYSGTDSFTYHASDGSLNSNLVAVTLTISPAVSTILANGSFETDFTGWTKSGNITTQSALPYKPSAGSKLVAFNNANLSANGVLSQTFTTVVGRTYNLTFDLGVLSYNASAQKMLVTVVGKKTVLSKTLNLTGTGGGTCVWTTQNFTFVADRTTSTLSFRDQSTATIGLDLVLDRVQVIDAALNTTMASASTLSTTSAPSLAITRNTSVQSQSTTITTLATPELKSSAGALTIRMVATDVGTYVLEHSEDLITWTWVSELKVSAPRTIEFPADPRPISSGRVFYRVGFQPN